MPHDDLITFDYSKERKIERYIEVHTTIFLEDLLPIDD